MSPLGHFQILVCLFALLIFSSESRKLQSSNDTESSGDVAKGKRWAVLVAGSKDYFNYRHQADICHAYQVLRKGGLKDENIIVFMYDDIAFSPENPRPGVIINRPDGDDVYQGVPKDYNGEAVTKKNFFNVLRGNKSGIIGGSGKVLKSGPNDNVFIYYADHGSPGLIGMPTSEDILARDFIKVLEKMHKLKRYKKMVIYVESCESGSMFQGMLNKNLNILAVTAANAEENSFGAYCPGSYPSPPDEYTTCLGDVFSVSWLEDSDLHDMSKETLKQQYKVVRRRTGTDDGLEQSSHVCYFGTETILKDYLVSYIGTNPANKNFTFAGFTSKQIANSSLVNTRDIPLLYLQSKIQKAPMDSLQRQEAQKKLSDEMNHRKQMDQNIIEILRVSTRQTNVLNLLTSTRTKKGQPLVDDWDCFATLVDSFKKHCGATMDYGLKYTGALANICNMKVDVKQTVSAMEQACSI